jgi:hypothetical protein
MQSGHVADDMNNVTVIERSPAGGTGRSQIAVRRSPEKST